MIRQKVSLLFLGCFALLTIAFITPQPVTAQAATPLTQIACTNMGPLFGFPTWDACLKQKYGSLKIAELNDVWLIVLPLIESVIKATAYIVVGFIIWGGVKYTKSQGDPKKLVEARTTILNAVVGFIICLVSVAIVRFVAGSF